MPFNYKKPQQEQLIPLIKPLLTFSGPLPSFEFSDYNKAIENTANFMQVFFAGNIQQFYEDYSGIVEFSGNKIRRSGEKQWPLLLTQFMNSLRDIFETNYGVKVNWKGNQEFQGKIEQKTEQKPKTEQKQEEEKKIEQKQEKTKQKEPICVYDEDKKIYKIEYYNGSNEPIVIKDISIMTTIELFNCQNITVIVDKKCKLIQLLKCKKVKIQCESIISDINYLYCEQIKTLVKGNLGSINLENSSDIQVQFMNNPEDVEINMFASKEVKVFYEDGEYAVPDHYVCKLKDKKIEVDVVDFGAE